MSDRFVSGGTISSTGEVTKDAEPAIPQQQPVRSTEWEVVQRELEAERKRREEARVKAATGEEERSLYDVLQANKAAKQAEFEEQSKVRNQFRALDDDEVDFLDEVRQRERKEDERVRRETEEGLRAFRERQKGGGDDGVEDKGEGKGEAWGVGRKRKRAKDKEIKGVRRRASDGEAKEDVPVKKTADVEKKSAAAETKPKVLSPPPKEKKASALVDYGSDDSDND